MRVDVINYRGIDKNETPINAGEITTVAGKNAIGKSSTLEAIAAVAMRNHNPLDLKAKTQQQYGHNGAGNATAILYASTALDSDTVKINFGKNVETHGSSLGIASRCTQWIDRFSDLSKSDRKSVLADLMDAKITADDFAEFNVLPERVAEWLESGEAFEDIHSRLSEARKTKKRDWHSLTGINYGKKEAERYVPEGMSVDDEFLSDDELQGKINSAKADYDKISAVKTIDAEKLEYAKRRVGETNKANLDDVIAVNQKDIETFTAEIENLRSQYRKQPNEVESQDCPCCSAKLTIDAGVIVQAPTSQLNRTEISNIIQHNDLLRRKANVEKSKIESANNLIYRAKRQLSELADANALIETAKDIDSNHDANLAIAQKLYSNLKNTQELIVKYRKAQAEYLAICEYDEMILATDPAKGAPAKAGQRAQKAFNDVCENISGGQLGRFDFDWDSGDIFYNNRQIELVSKSERWRIDALLVLAIAAHTKTDIVTIDDFECCDDDNKAFFKSACERAFALHGKMAVLVGEVV